MDLLKNYLPTQSYQALLREKAARLKASNPLVTLPIPYPLQAEIIHHPAKRKVVCAGRRVGKTITAALMAVEAMLKAQRVVLSSTSQDQADVFWEYIVDWLAPLIGSGLYKNEVKRIVKYAGGQIHVKTGRHPDALRGGKADLLVLDECAFLDADAWGKVGAPMLADTQGTAVFISTPNRRNWFFELYQKALVNESGEWAAWNFSTLTNPHLPEPALKALISDMTEADYEQEILAKFLEGEGAVFRRIDENATLRPCDPQLFHKYIFGVDWAQVHDFTVIVVMDKTTREMVYMDRFNQQDWALQRGRLVALYQKYQPETIIAESNSIGGPNIEALTREGLPMRSFETTSMSKAPLIESLVLAFERDEIKVLNNPKLKGELMAYERKVTATGRSQYSAPEGMHDDCVMATALAWHGIVNQPVSFARTPMNLYPKRPERKVIR